MQLIGNIKISPSPSIVTASKHITRVAFSSNDSGSYIHGGTNPYTGIGPQTGSLTFENSGSLFTFIFSGSGFVTSSGYPGTVISASINGLNNSGSIAGAFTSSVLLNTSMTASIISGNIVELTNSIFSTSSLVTSSFPNSVLYAYTKQNGTPLYYESGSNTTGSLEVTGSVSITGSITLNNKLITGITTKYITIPSASVLQANATPVLLGLDIPAGTTPNILTAFQFVATGGTAYATNISSSLRSSGSSDNLFIATSLDDTAGNEYRFIPQSTYNAISGRDLVWTILNGESINGNRDVTVVVSYFLI